MDKLEIKYRTYYKGIPPKKIKLKIPGWSGDSKDYGDGAKPQPWHCVPFVEGSTYGLELIYPFETECVVTREDGKIKFQEIFPTSLLGAKTATHRFRRSLQTIMGLRPL